MYKNMKKLFLLLLVLIIPLGLLISAVSSNLQTSQGDILTPYESSTELTVDGIDNEAAWGSATPLAITTAQGTLANTEVTLKAVYTSSNIYILASWDDSTFSITRDKYNVSGGQFDQGLAGSNSEDRIALLWEIGTIEGFNSSGCATKCHGLGTVNFSNPGEIGDMWHVKAARGGGVTSAAITSALTIDSTSYEATAGTISLVGYADDKHVDDADRQSDAGTSAYSDNTNGTHAAWIEANPSDWLDAMIITQAEISGGEAINITEGLENGWANLTWAVGNYTALNANVPRHILRTPAGSRGDIEVGMTWSDGTWTVEIKRELDTMNADDVAFTDTTSGMHHFSVAIMDNEGQGTTGISHSMYSGPIMLEFTTTGAGAAIPGFNLLLILGSLVAISILLIKYKISRKNK
ncbi:MAG: ethylbenzene dehydrogenase-related protein [Promethearchaeota archaeon]|jgi:hypothetical protein